MICEKCKSEVSYQSNFCGICGAQILKVSTQSIIEKKVEPSAYIFERLGIELDAEKEDAVAIVDKNILLTARAGSGKTTAIAAKIFWLNKVLGVDRDKILALAFNRKAAHELKDRIRNKFHVEDFSGAMTFHSLAYKILRKTEPNILNDDKEEWAQGKEKSQLIRTLNEIIRSNANKWFRLRAWWYLRNENKEEEDTLESQHTRNLKKVTLNGEEVKSAGEKYIADYLFEHGINYQYEKSYQWGNRPYKPDFSIPTRDGAIIIEHWGIDENDPQKSVADDFTKSWSEYHDLMLKKRKYWQDKINEGFILVETSIADLRNGRETFENIFAGRLAAIEVRSERLSDEEISSRVLTKNHSKLVEQFKQFISLAQVRGELPEDIETKINNYSGKTKVFIELANKVYADYEAYLIANGLTDFHHLLRDAIQCMHDSEGSCEIDLDDAGDRKVRMNELEWILIDEFQDFSKSFYDMVQAIRHYNPHVRFFCVGDDWQAINGYAGSDLVYFHSFQEWMNDAEVKYLLNNYRSGQEIVHFGNCIMYGNGKTAQPILKGGMIKWKRLNISNSYAVLEAYLETCKQTILERPGKSFGIINRTNNICKLNLDVFKERLKKSFTAEELRMVGDFDRRIKVSTVHSFKGKEADCIILPQVYRWFYPLLHPDSQLYEILGQSISSIISEEMRLFYVACTRAREELLLLTSDEERTMSPFLLLALNNLQKIEVVDNHENKDRTPSSQYFKEAKYYFDSGFNISCISACKNKFNSDAENTYFKSPNHEYNDLFDRHQTLAELGSYPWSESIGFGIITGFNDLLVIDIDDCTEEFLSETINSLDLSLDYQWIVRSGSKKGFHIYVFLDNLRREFNEAVIKLSPKYQYSLERTTGRAKVRKVELLFRLHAILPPSEHPSGNLYEFFNKDRPVVLPKRISRTVLDKFMHHFFDLSKTIEKTCSRSE